jgi:putative ABC transport system permease protein
MNFLSMNQAVQPQLFHQFASGDRFHFNGEPFHFFVRIRPGDPQKALSAIEKIWTKAAPDFPLRYNFLDEDLNRFYAAEIRLSRIVGWAGGIAIFLACLGLLGLAALASINRTKEIGIRKVMGASVASIVALISRDFIRLVAIAFLLSVPLVWYFINQWLQGYYYHINISWWVFGLTGASIIGIAWLTIAFRAIKAGRDNPVNSLRSE